MKKLLSLILVLCMACMLVPAMAAEAADIVGEWEMTEMSANGQTFNPSAMGISWTMTFEEDGNFVSAMNMMGEEEKTPTEPADTTKPAPPLRQPAAPRAASPKPATTP